jgi:hypothetical protein
MTEDEKREIVRKAYDTLDRTLKYTQPVEHDLLQEFYDKRRRRQERKAQREEKRWEQEPVTKPYTPAVVKIDYSNGQEDWSEWNAWAVDHVQRGIAAHQDFEREVLGEVLGQVKGDIDRETRSYVSEVKSQVTALGAKIETLRERQMLERTAETRERALDIRAMQLLVEQLHRRIDELEAKREADLKEAVFRIAAWLGNLGPGH